MDDKKKRQFHTDYVKLKDIERDNLNLKLAAVFSDAQLNEGPQKIDRNNQRNYLLTNNIIIENSSNEYYKNEGNQSESESNVESGIEDDEENIIYLKEVSKMKELKEVKKEKNKTH